MTKYLAVGSALHDKTDERFDIGDARNPGDLFNRLVIQNSRRRKICWQPRALPFVALSTCCLPIQCSRSRGEALSEDGHLAK